MEEFQLKMAEGVALPLELIQLIVAFVGAGTGIASLYIHYRNLVTQRPFLVAWVTSASYLFQDQKNCQDPDLNLEIELQVQNKGVKDTTISNAFAEVRVGKPFPAIHSAEGQISVIDVDETAVSGTVSLRAGDSKTIKIEFVISSVDPETVERAFLPKTPSHPNILQDPIAVDFTIRHTHGSLYGRWFVYNKKQSFEQSLTRWSSSQKIREGEPNWIENKKRVRKKLPS
jgi:hypothetical protein